MVWRLGGLSLSSCSAASTPTPDPPLAPQKLRASSPCDNPRKHVPPCKPCYGHLHSLAAPASVLEKVVLHLITLRAQALLLPQPGPSHGCGPSLAAILGETDRS